MKRHWPALILALLAILVFRRVSSFGSVRQEGAQLATQLESLATANATAIPAQSTVGQPSAADLEQLHQRAARVYRLRGDVTMAQEELDKLAPTVTNLAARLQARTNQLEKQPEPEFPPGYLPRNELANRGNATPESAVETFLWAFTQGDFGTLKSLVVELENEPEQDPVGNQRRNQEIKSMFARFPGYRIVTREQFAPDKVKFAIETAPGSSTFDFILVLQNGFWKVLKAGPFFGTQ